MRHQPPPARSDLLARRFAPLRLVAERLRASAVPADAFFDPDDFMLMSWCRADRPQDVMLFKHVDTRHYLNLDADGAAYRYVPPATDAADDEGTYVRHAHAARRGRRGRAVGAALDAAGARRAPAGPGLGGPVAALRGAHRCGAGPRLLSGPHGLVRGRAAVRGCPRARPRLHQAGARARGAHQRDRRRAGGRHHQPRVHDEPARGVRARGRPAARRGARRFASPRSRSVRPRPRSSSATRRRSASARWCCSRSTDPTGIRSAPPAA